MAGTTDVNENGQRKATLWSLSANANLLTDSQSSAEAGPKATE
ncbi:hypothetical protein [Tatumella morbirosei]|nr:hypothetical protein [Tatumella morbirosei]